MFGSIFVNKSEIPEACINEYIDLDDNMVEPTIVLDKSIVQLRVIRHILDNLDENTETNENNISARLLRRLSRILILSI